MKIVILDGSAANPGDLSWEPFEKFGEVVAYDVTRQEELVDRAIDAEVCITNKTAFDSETISKLPNLKYIGVLATGFNVVDLKACSSRGIVVTNVPEYSTMATSQMTVALILEMTNMVKSHSDSVMSGDWVKSPQFCYWNSPLTELMDKTVAVIGYGKIGKRVAIILNALGMKVLAVPHTPKGVDSDGVAQFVTMDEAQERADFITFHCPLTDETKEIINEEFIGKCKDGVRIINAARGGLADEKAVREALESGKLKGYAADTVKIEPMREDNLLLGAPNCLLTPHIAWAPLETRARLIRAAADNLEGYLNGNVINKVN